MVGSSAEHLVCYLAARTAACLDSLLVAEMAWTTAAEKAGNLDNSSAVVWDPWKAGKMAASTGAKMVERSAVMSVGLALKRAASMEQTMAVLMEQIQAD